MAAIFVSFTSSDRLWAFWIGQVLKNLGHVSLPDLQRTNTKRTMSHVVASLDCRQGRGRIFSAALFDCSTAHGSGDRTEFCQVRDRGIAYSQRNGADSYQSGAERHLRATGTALWNRTVMIKLAGIILALLPVLLLLRSILMGSKKGSQAIANFKKQVDYVVWVILLLIGCSVVYGIWKLLYDLR